MCYSHPQVRVNISERKNISGQGIDAYVEEVLGPILLGLLGYDL